MLVFGLLFLYVIFLQLLPLYRHHRTLVWIDLYPINVEVRRNNFVQWIRQMVSVVAILFFIPFVLERMWIEAAIMLAISLLFVQIGIPAFIQKKYNGQP